ncbi:MAG: hypothetical protein Q4C85_05165 [Actinomyces sp.]|uniref:hypothetical protein n=1 Tax=Actinomyces sp. TaxID=29317 RepID=UPI0026DB0F69|nr:hypothetical protein [Actinomyces sp.]MDO4243140.1 hypothetical protein [Actinomyces sp.]
MSAARTTGARRRRQDRPGGPGGVGGLLRAEMLRTRRTATWGVPLAVALFAVQALLVAHTARTATGWNDGVMAWMGTYPTSFALPMGGLVGAMAAWREQRLRAGGTAWRAVRPRDTVLVRMAVLTVSAALSQVLLMGPVVIDALVRGEGFGPWARYLAFMAVMTVAVSAASFWGLALGQLIGGVAVGLVPAAALCWSVAGAVRAESASWWAEPWTWSIRPVLPLLGVHGNNLALEPGSVVWSFPVMPGVLLTAGLGALGALAALAGSSHRAGGPEGRLPNLSRLAPRRSDAAHELSSGAPSPSAAPQPHTRTASAPHVPVADRGRRSVALAVALSLPWRVWGGLALTLAALIGIVNVVYPVTYSLTLLTLAGAPTAAWVAGMTSWGAQAPSWRVLVLRARPAALTIASLAWVMALLLAALVPSWVAAVWGEPLLRTDPGLGALSGAVYVLLVMPCVCLMLAATAHALTQVAGTVTAIVVAVGAFLTGVVIAGNEALVGTWLWYLAPWGWMEATATYPQRWVLVGVLALSLSVLAVLVSTLSGRRVAARSGS